MNQTFSLDTSVPVALYGAATIGTLLYKKYKEWKLNVVAFLDKRADEIESFIGLPCYSVENDILDKQNVVVIVAVKNVFEHSRIATKLQKSGYKRIIYRPYNSLNDNGSPEENCLNGIYSHITEDAFFDAALYKVVPFVDALASIPLKERGVIKKENGNVTFYLPVTMLFKDKKGAELERQHSILCLKPHVNFAKFIIGNGGEVESLLNYCIVEANKMQTIKVTDAWKKNVIANQSEIYLDMLHKLNLEPDFFINKSVNVIWNDERKYFNLNSGKHRASFLCAAGLNYIPVSCSEADYKKYLAAIDISATQKKINSMFDDGLSYPVENPFFFDSSRYGEQFWFLLVRAVAGRIMEWYYDNGKILKGLKVYWSISKTEFLENFLIRIGCRLEKESTASVSGFYDIAFVDATDKANLVAAEHCFLMTQTPVSDKKCILTALREGTLCYLYELCESR